MNIRFLLEREKSMRLRAICAAHRLSAFVLASFLILTVFKSPAAWAGPPFITDDPEPVEHHHGEFYVASQYADNEEGKEGTLPHFEFNYGVVPDVQLHVLIPFMYVHPNGGATAYGFGDTEVGVKYRFLHEGDATPQVGVFPIMHLPTGDADRGLGNRHVPFFLPVWLQKSWGRWTTYGGGGYWINPGEGNKNFYQIGWLVQRSITNALAIGAEIFSFGQDTENGRGRTGYNVGGIFNLSEDHHLLFSAGSDLSGDNKLSSYIAWQWTFGPHEQVKKE
ncbi:MAG TPA: transporter [Nitrospirota bacterium]|nr:transporter [Nitrospirota bacterium]